MDTHLDESSTWMNSLLPEGHECIAVSWEQAIVVRNDAVVCVRSPPKGRWVPQTSSGDIFWIENMSKSESSFWIFGILVKKGYDN